MLKIVPISLVLILCIFFSGCSSHTEIINSPRRVEGLYLKTSPKPVSIIGSTAQIVESKNYSYTYDEVYNATVLSLSFNKYNILIDSYEDGFISGRNKFCTYAIYLEENAKNNTVKMTIIYDIFTNLENKYDLIRRDVENQFMTVFRFL